MKNPPAIRETWVRSLSWEDPLEKGKAAHSSISGLETSMDGIVYRVTKSQTRLSDLHFSLSNVEMLSPIALMGDQPPSTLS